ncbi:NTF2-like protein [Viridothelium virens]|uniref:NTF2-like protein n=1 Tax=Viridothelium virens TaxID=1048519 RepID=A0A6A6HH60_VIRVR|nr:NTF2-like protein [Viridothelium virens]
MAAQPDERGSQTNEISERNQKQAQAIAEQFVEFYYRSFDQKAWDELGAYYQLGSWYTWQGDAVENTKESPTAILDKLKTLPFEKITHALVSNPTEDWRDAIRAQPVANSGAIAVAVMGRFSVDQEGNQLPFTQTFLLMPIPQGGYYIQSDFFRIMLV